MMINAKDLNHQEALEAYKTLATYMQRQNCHPHQEKCPNCIFHMHYHICLVQRLGLYPELAFREEDIKEISENIKKKMKTIENWKADKPTNKQLNFIKELEAEFGEKFTGTTKGEASDYIDKWVKVIEKESIDRFINWDAESRFG